MMRLLSYQALAHGADTVMFFQLRASVAGVEKFHGAVISHAGHEHTRVFQECAKLGNELKNLEDRILDSKYRSQVAIMFDWDNWWAVELSSGPSRDLQYFEQVEKYYHALYEQNIAVDIVRPDADLSKYDLVIAPLLYMTKPGVAKNIETFVENGGTFVTSFLSGIVDENDHVILGGYPGELKRVLGIWVEEFDALLPGMKNTMEIIQPTKDLEDLEGQYECGLICDVVHLKGAEALAVYGEDFYAGKPCLTLNQYGKGKAYHIATDPEEQFIKDFIKNICDDQGILVPINAPQGVEITQRFKEDKTFTFILNHNDFSISIDLGQKKYENLITGKEKSGKVNIAAKGVFILEEL